MLRSRQIEKQWLRNFRKSPLVDESNGRFRTEAARQLYFPKTDPGYPEELPTDFERVFHDYPNWPANHVVETCLQFLAVPGIKIKASRVYEHLARYPADLSKLVTKTHYVLKTLAQGGSSLDIGNPYRDVDRDIFFLARIASGESVMMGQLNLFEDLEIPDLHKRLTALPAGYAEQSQVRGLMEAIENSNDSFFITGKAGTGKSTFIHYFAQATQKKVLLTAFTGVAAVNVHGQTLHSFFQLPLKPLVPGDHEIKIFGDLSEKRKIIERVQTIVVDEVSMLRADLLEAIDHSLRKNGGNPDLPFGGKQLIFVGDLFQLPPVLDQTDEIERELFKDPYDSEYFFGSPAYRHLNPRFFEFTEAHRQQGDPRFVELLDRIRMCEADEEALRLINSRFQPDFKPDPDEFVVHLTATNAGAQTENFTRLEALPYTEYTFQATVMGEFPSKKLNVEQQLRLKRGAQVMFIRNDPQKRWVNGTIGIVEFITTDGINVKLQNGSVHRVERERWENRRYKFERRERKIMTEVEGTFEQYPLKLAWAITIHKSQGLTFDRVIIDLGQGAFVPGQVYTALSRCRSLDGIYLRSKITANDLIADERILRFYERLQPARTT